MRPINKEWQACPRGQDYSNTEGIGASEEEVLSHIGAIREAFLEVKTLDLDLQR